MTQGEIDESVWLPKGSSIITEERASKGDKFVERDENGAIRHVQGALATVMNSLERLGLIDGQNSHDGQTYEVWQTVFRSRMGYRNNPIYQTDLAGMRRMVKDDDLEVDDFGKLIHALGADACRWIETAIYEHATPRTALLIHHKAQEFQAAFDKLSRVMEQLRADWRRRQDEKNTCADVDLR